MPHHDGTNYSFIGLGGTGAEIDILEHLYPDRDHYQTTVHWGGYDESHQSWTVTPKPYMGSMNNWHNFAVEWTPTQLTFMVDGNAVATYDGEAVPYGPEFVILSLGLGGWIGTPDKTKMPAEMLVDYVRIYQRNDNLENGRYKIVSEYTGKYLSASNAVEGSQLTQTTTANTASKWIVEKTPEGFYTIKNASTGYCIDAYGRQTDNGVKIIQWSPTGGINQDWDLRMADNGCYYIVNRNSRKLVDIYGRWTNEGAPIIQYENLGHDNQRWAFVPVTD